MDVWRAWGSIVSEALGGIGSWPGVWISLRCGASKEYLSEALFSWVAVGPSVGPLHSPLCLFLCLFPGMISIASDRWFLILGLLTPEGSNNVCGSCRADPRPFLCTERWDRVPMSQQGVLLLLFTAGVCLCLLFLSGFL